MAKTHGMTGSREFTTWQSMKKRCVSPSPKDIIYRKKGITVCDRWINSFVNFYSDMGKKPEGKSLDRKDNDGDYTPENCRWATPSEQAKNRCTTIYVTYEGETLCLTDWAKKLGFIGHTFLARYRRGLRGSHLFKPLRKIKGIHY